MDKEFDTMNPDGFSSFNGPIFSFNIVGDFLNWYSLNLLEIHYIRSIVLCIVKWLCIDFCSGSIPSPWKITFHSAEFHI